MRAEAETQVHGARFLLRKATVFYSQRGLQNYFIARGHTNGPETELHPVLINPRLELHF